MLLTMKVNSMLTFVLLIGLFLASILKVGHSNVAMVLKHDECDEDIKFFGLDEMVRHVERAIDECELVAVTRGELFRCFYKQVNMSEFSDADGTKAMRQAISMYIPSAYPKKVLKDSDEYANNIKNCTNHYREEGTRKKADLKTVHGFLECFYNHTKKFAADIRDYCKSIREDYDDDTTTKKSRPNYFGKK